MAKAKSKPDRSAPKGRTTAKTAARNIGNEEDRDRVGGPRGGRTSAKDAAAQAVARPTQPRAPKKAASPDTAAADTAERAPKKVVSGPKPKPAPTKRTAAAPTPSARYTPPVPRSVKVSPIWVPILMFACLGIGMAIIIVNYVSVLPGSPSNVYLMIGLGLITVGFITATKYH